MERRRLRKEASAEAARAVYVPRIPTAEDEKRDADLDEMPSSPLNRLDRYEALDRYSRAE